MVSQQGQQPFFRKRPHNEVEILADDVSQDVKKRKTKPEKVLEPGHHRAWDSLSKIWLTRRALKELDSRHRQQVGGFNHSTASRSTVSSSAREVKRFSRHGGPDLTHLRGFSPFVAADVGISQSGSKRRKRSSHSNKTGTTKTSRSTPYSNNFQQKLIDCGIYPDGYKFPGDKTFCAPMNQDEIRQRLQAPRSSLSPSQLPDDTFQDFIERNTRASNEPNLMATVIPIIAGNGDKRHQSAVDVFFNNLAPIDKDLSAPKPDAYDGALPETIHQQVRKELGPYIVPSTDTSLPAAPNFFGEWKSMKGRSDIGKRQACNDAVAGARGMNKLQNYGAESPVFDNNAYTLATTFHDGQLRIYAMHPSAPKVAGDPPKYHMTQLDSYAMTGNIRNFREGVAAYRTGRDWSAEQREILIENANKVAMHKSTDLSSSASSPGHTTLSAVLDTWSDTSADELALNDDGARKRIRSTATPHLNEDSS